MGVGAVAGFARRFGPGTWRPELPEPRVPIDCERWNAVNGPAAARAMVVRTLTLMLVLVSTTSGVRGQPHGDCQGLTASERELARLFEETREQRRRAVRCDPVLSRVARARAVDMGTRRYFRHVSPEGNGPNRQVEAAGYALPSLYSRRRSANNIEVITAGDETPLEAWQSWLRSRSHRRQVLGLTAFFAEQTDYGVGHAEIPNSRYRHYWVLIAARH